MSTTNNALTPSDYEMKVKNEVTALASEALINHYMKQTLKAIEAEIAKGSKGFAPEGSYGYDRLRAAHANILNAAKLQKERNDKSAARIITYMPLANLEAIPVPDRKPTTWLKRFFVRIGELQNHIESTPPQPKAQPKAAQPEFCF